MSTTPNRSLHATSWVTPPPASAHGDHHIVRNLLITVGASAVILAGLAAAQFVRTQDNATGVVATSASAYEAFVPGGSVYAQQVPQAASAYEAFAPGGSVYAQQVPQAASAYEAFVPGGSVYVQQVPTARG